MTTTEVLEYLFGIVKERGYELQINVGKLLSSCRDNGVANYLFSKLNVDLSSIAGRDRVLEHAVQSGNAMIVREFVNHSGIQIDNRGQYFGGMLSYASDPTIIRLLLNAKADVTIDDSDDPVMGAAIEELQLESVKMLVEAGAGRSKRSFRYALELSCTDDKVDDKIAIINLLIDVGASTRDVYAWDNVNSAMYTCLHHTAIGFDVHPLETIRALHERDPGMLNCTDYRYGITPLMLAVSRQDVPVSVVKELLEMGADMDIKDSTGVPLLQLLFLPPPDESGAGDFLRDDTPSKIREKLPLLLSLGADPNVTEFKGVTIPMMLLAADGTGTDSTETFFRDIDASEEDDVSWSSNYSDDACSIFISDILDSILARPTAAATMPSDEDESVSQPSKRQRR
jgi:ankyrin repeat protein